MCFDQDKKIGWQLDNETHRNAIAEKDIKSVPGEDKEMKEYDSLPLRIWPADETRSRFQWVHGASGKIKAIDGDVYLEEVGPASTKLVAPDLTVTLEREYNLEEGKEPIHRSVGSHLSTEETKNIKDECEGLVLDVTEKPSQEESSDSITSKRLDNDRHLSQVVLSQKDSSGSIESIEKNCNINKKCLKSNERKKRSRTISSETEQNLLKILSRPRGIDPVIYVQRDWLLNGAGGQHAKMHEPSLSLGRVEVGTSDINSQNKMDIEQQQKFDRFYHLRRYAMSTFDIYMEMQLRNFAI